MAENVIDGGATDGAPDASALEATGTVDPLEATSGDAGLDAGQDAGPAAAPDATPGQGQPAILGTTLNGTMVGDLLVVIRASDVAVKTADLRKAGLRPLGGRQLEWDHETFVWLGSLSPNVTFIFDEPSLSLTITADPSLFPASVVDLRAKRPEGILDTAEPSLFLNYAASLYELQRPSDSRWNGFAEAGWSLRGALFYSNGQHTPQGSWLRGQSNITYDWREKLVRMVVGDSVSTSDMLGGTLTMAGLSVGRAFALDPYFVMLPSMQLAGTALTPSTVDVYVNGQLVRRETLAPGQFALQNVPLTTGSGETRVVVRDAFGGERTMASPYYLALGTLAKGLADFSYNVGLVRRQMTTASFDYGGPAALVRHRFGWTDWLTVGARVEATGQLVSGGPSASARLPIGEVALLLAASTTFRDRTVPELPSSTSSGAELRSYAAGPGGAALLSYSYVGRMLNLQVGATVQSDRYVNLALNLESDRKRIDVASTVALTLASIAMVSLQYDAADWRDRRWLHRLMLLANRNLTGRLHAFVTLGCSLSDPVAPAYDTFAGLAYFVGERTTASATRSDRFSEGGHAGTSHLDLQRSLPIGPGYGYRLVAEQGTSAVEEATGQWQGTHGRLEADYRHEGLRADQPGHATLTAAGGLVFIHRDFFFTRPVQDSYALIHVPGVPGVQGTLSNQVVGTTNAKGNLLVPNLLPYYGNRLGIDDKDIPLDFVIDATEMIVAPPYRGGAIASFPIHFVQRLTGTLTIGQDGIAVIPAYGRITIQVGRKQVNSPIDASGAFYLEIEAPEDGAGPYQAEVEFEGGLCRFDLVVPTGSAAMVNMGSITCHLAQEKSPP
jgi:outer membrane usher protein